MHRKLSCQSPKFRNGSLTPRIEGAPIGGILIGLVEAGWSAYFAIDMRDIVVFSILIVMFVLRPGGLLGIAGPHARDV